MQRSIWIDDSGSGTDGTVINNAELQKIYDNIELELISASFPAIKAKAAIDAVMVGPTHLGGDAGRYRKNIAIPTGSTYDLLAPGTGIFNVDPAWLTGSWRFEAVLRLEAGGTAAGAVASAALVNLTDAPNTALVTITGSSDTGIRVRSGIIAFGAGGAAKDFGVKIWTSNANFGANLAWARLVKTA